MIDGYRLPGASGAGAILDLQTVGVKIRLDDLPSHHDLTRFTLPGLKLELGERGVDHHPQPGPVGSLRPELA